MHNDATTDVGPAPVIGDTAPPDLSETEGDTLDPVEAGPSEQPAPEPEDRDLEDELDDTMLPIQRVEDQVLKTDLALTRWRQESVERRQAWEDAQAEAAAELELRRGRLRIWMGATVVILGALVAAGATAYSALTTRDTPASIATTTPDPVEQVAPVRAVTPVQDPAPSEVAVAEAEAPPTELEAPAELDAVAEAAAPVEAVAPSARSRAPAIRRDTVAFWQADGLSWTRAIVDHEQPAYLEWLDAEGSVALEPMPCGALRPDGTRSCVAGRSRSRIRHALASGAEPGTWTVRICGTIGCATAGTFEVAPL